MKKSSHFNQSALAENNRSNTSLQTTVPFSWKGVIIMLHFFCILCLAAGLRAQPNILPFNSEYGKIIVGTDHQFFQFKVADGDRFPTSGTSIDPSINLSSEFGAANGYGFWTISSNFGSNVKI